MTKQDFIQKWLAAYDSLDELIEPECDMLGDLESIQYAQRIACAEAYCNADSEKGDNTYELILTAEVK